MSGAQAPGQSEARIGGIAYLVTIFCGLFAEVFTRSGIRSASHPAETLTNLRGSESLFRLGIGADLAMLGSYIVVTVILYRLFRERDAVLSAVAAGFSLIGIAVLAFATLFLLAALIVAVPANGITELSLNQIAASVDLALRVQSRGYGLSLVFFGVYCCLIGTMIVRGGLLPKWVGGLMFLGGATFLVTSVAAIVAPEVARQIPPVTMLASLMGEGAVAIWLTIFGIRFRTAEADVPRPEGRIT